MHEREGFQCDDFTKNLGQKWAYCNYLALYHREGIYDRAATLHRPTQPSVDVSQSS